MKTGKYLEINETINFMMDIHHKVIDNYLKNVSGYHYDMHDIAFRYSKFSSNLPVRSAEAVKINNFSLNFLSMQWNAWNQIFNNSIESITQVIEPKEGDNRFSDPEWDNNPYFNFIKQNYLLASALSKQIIGEIEIDEKNRKKMGFYAGQYVDAFSPSNFFFTNPEVLKLAVETKGKSLLDGMNILLDDLKKGKITQTDEEAFNVGDNLAITPGAIIFENELIQLIQYTPITNKNFAIPLVIIPPWINKYYILDLQEKNSFVKFILNQQVSVFMISWRNPKPGMGNLSLDDYVVKGALKAIEVANSISGSKKVNMLGYCLGGTLLSIACSILSSDKKESPVNSATFVASMVDFSDVGSLGDIIDYSLIRKLERGELLYGGVLNGRYMEAAFNLIRPNDLIWSFVINNYLKGKKPKAFDIIYWTNDNTNLPADMFTYYIKHMVLENKLSTKDALNIYNTPIDIGKIDLPVIVIGLIDDIISPAITTFKTTELVNGPVEFILGGSGHVMGVINPPSKNKYGYYLNGELGNGFEKWKETSDYFSGSWWPLWADRLKKLSGEEVSATLELGNEKYVFIEDAPGSYVKEKC